MYVVHVLLACSRVPFVHALPILLHSYEFSQLVLSLNFVFGSRGDARVVCLLRAPAEHRRGTTLRESGGVCLGVSFWLGTRLNPYSETATNRPRCRCRRMQALEDVVRAMSEDAARREVTDSEREDAARQAGREDLSPRHRGNLQARAQVEVV